MLPGEPSRLYRLRLYPDAADRSRYLVASARASCFASPDAQEQLFIEADLSGAPVGLSYSVASSTCGREEGGSAAAAPNASLPPTLMFFLRTPTMAAPIQTTDGGALASYLGAAAPAAPSAAPSSSAQGDRGAAAGQAGGKAPPPKDDRPWWQVRHSPSPAPLAPACWCIAAYLPRFAPSACAEKLDDGPWDRPDGAEHDSQNERPSRSWGDSRRGPRRGTEVIKATAWHRRYIDG